MKRLIFISLLIISMVISIAGCGSTTQPATSSTGAISNADSLIKIPISEISSKLEKYSLVADGTNINYFIVKGSDGEIRTAFDACDVCGGYKGYRQQGNDVVCNNCGRVFKIDDIGTKNRGGGCWPSYLSYRIEGEYILINPSEIAKGAFRFK